MHTQFHFNVQLFLEKICSVSDFQDSLLKAQSIFNADEFSPAHNVPSEKLDFLKVNLMDKK